MSNAKERLQEELKKEYLKPSYLDNALTKYHPGLSLTKVSAVVPTFNRCPNPVSEDTNPLGWCLESLVAQGGGILDEVVIIDDASTDNTADLVRHFESQSSLPIVYHRNENNLGSSISRNRAVEMSKNDNIMFLDDDCVFSRWMLFGANFTLESLGDSVAAVHMPVYHRKTVPKPINKRDIGVLNLEKGVITGNYDGFPEEYIGNPEDAFIDKDLKILRPIEIKNLGGIFIIKKDIFQDIGGFPEFFTWRNGYREETDVALRLQREGHKIYFSPDPKFYCVHLKYGASGEQDIRHLDPSIRSLIEQSNVPRINTGNRVKTREWFYAFITSTYTTLGRESREAAQKFKYEMYKNFVVGNTLGVTGTEKKIHDYGTREAIFDRAIQDGDKIISEAR